MNALYTNPLAWEGATGAYLGGAWRRVGLALLLSLLALAARAQAKPQLQLDLEGTISPLRDPTFLYEQAGATTDFNPGYDAVELANSSGLKLTSLAPDGQQLDKKGLPLASLTAPLTVKLYVGVPQEDQYTLSVSQLSIVSANVYLVDAQEQIRQLLTLGAAYTFSLAEAVPGGTYTTSTRFSLVFEPAAPLPVTLVSFTAQRQGSDGLLEWATATEQQNAYFQVESSSDGHTFYPLGQVAGAGTSTTHHTYQFRDANLARYAGPQVYYRLRQFDEDGASVFSPVRLLAVPTLGLVVAAFPSPVPPGQALHLLVHSATAGAAWLYVADTQGRRVGQHLLDLGAGASEVTLPEAARWIPGLYFVQVRQGAQQRAVKIVKP
jgi:hypothetical protein